ncbi:MAG: glycosyltransferase family 4 protein [Erythrobacter sp.]
MKIAIVTRGYPSQDFLYNHAFVHRRVLAYRERGHEVTVLWLRPRPQLDRYVFDGVEVLVRTPAEILEILAEERPDTIALHAPGDDFARVIEDADPAIPMNGWIYGSEIMPFWEVTQRAEHDRERWEKARAVFFRRIAYWRGLIERWPKKFRMVFVSEFAASEAKRAVGCAIPNKAILPSPVDTDLYTYTPKPPEQRFDVLLVRPFSDWRYANDLAVAAIEQLSTHAMFDRFRFRLMGEGHLFEETVAPLSRFGNVVTEQRFITQPEIARLHKSSGLFLCPTRNDAQGVSRDEAMSSGLVPLTNAVGAVPEFADETCAWLAPSENSSDLTHGMIALAEDPALFAKLSEGAARKIRDNLAMDTIIAREMDLMRF